MSRKVARQRECGPKSDLDIAEPMPALRRQIESDVVRRFATIMALLAAVAEIFLLALGVSNLHLGLALAIPILIGIMCGASASKDRSGAEMSRVAYLHPVRIGLSGGVALVGIGMHSVAGILIASAALLTLAWLPMPPLQLIVVALAAMSPWVAETIAGAQGVGSMVLGMMTIAVVTLAWVRSKDIEVLVVALCLATLLYVAAAVLLFLLGLRSAYSEGYLAEALTSYGPFTFRWRLPLSTSWVTVPTVATVGATLAVWALRIDGRQIGSGARAIKVLCAGGLVLNLVVVIAANGRTHLLIALVGVVVASGLLPRAACKVLVLVSSLLWLAPVWWSRFAGANDSVVATILSEYLPDRGSAASTATLQGRTHIWDIALDRFSRGTFVETIFGWGPDGHIASGAATEYSGLFRGVYRAAYYPPHSALLEVLLSGGVVMVGVVLAAIIMLLMMQMRVLRDGPAQLADGVAALGITLAGVAFTEVAVLPSNASVAAVTVSIATMVTLAAYGHSVQSRRQRDESGLVTTGTTR